MAEGSTLTIRQPRKDHLTLARVVQRSLLKLLCVILAAARLVLAYGSSDSTYWGRPVIGINLDSDARLTTEEFASQMTQKIGEPLERSKVSESLKNLYETGRFRELRADIQDKQYGVVLVFVGRAQYFVGEVRVEGIPKRVEPAALRSASRLRLGEPVSEDELNAARQRIRTVLANEGYHQARVDSQVTRHPEDQESDITFVIVPGKQARLSEVQFQGHPAVPPQRLASVARWRPGTHLTSEKLDRGLFRIRKFYVKRGRLEAVANVQERNYDGRGNSERLTVQVQAGPEVRVHVRGARISKRRLKHILPVYREGATDQLALSQGNQKLEEFLQEQGYFSAKSRVEREVSPGSETMDITYTVTRGPRGEFVGFAFKGNKSVNEDDLEAVMKIQPAAFPRFRGTFDHAFLEHDLKAMTMLYQSRGFLDVRITPEINENYANKAGNLFVTFNIEEGELVKVGQLAFHGLSPDLETSFRGSLLTRGGQPYSPTRAQTDRDTILTYFANQGYAHATVNWKASAPSPTHEVSLEYTVDPGARETIQQTIFMGNEHTRNSIIDRELTFDEGESLRQSSLLESQQRLYDLGVFNQVQIATQDPESPETQKTVLVDVEEAKRWTVQYGFGIDVQTVGSNQPQGQTKASPRFSFETTRLNVFGRAQTLTARGRFSDLEKGGAISYLIPRFMRKRNLDLRISGLSQTTRDVATFTARRQEGNLTFTKQYSRAFISGGYTYRRVQALNLNLSRISQEQLPLFSQPVRVAMLTGSYGNDHRDNPTDATAGSYSVADAGVAWNRLGSEANFVRISGQNATYYKLTRRLVFARNTRIGLEAPFGTNALLPGGIPLPERFFMGGSESHRGFGLSQAGPRDLNTGFPLGGKALLLNTFEFRTAFGINNRFGLVLFHDAGNVYSTIGTMRPFKFSQSSVSDFDYTVHAAGIGFRYHTPVVPLRFDVAYNLNPPRFEVHRPNAPVEVRRLSNIQFSISVGQSF